MTCNTSEVAVCCSNASRVSVRSRAFSIAMTACAAKFCKSAICLSVNGRTFFAMYDDRPEQCFVFPQRHHYPRADPARVDKLSVNVVCAVEVFLRSVG